MDIRRAPLRHKAYGNSDGEFLVLILIVIPILILSPLTHFQSSTLTNDFVLYIRRASLRHKDLGNSDGELFVAILIVIPISILFPLTHFQPSTLTNDFVLYIRRAPLPHKDYGNALVRSRWRFKQVDVNGTKWDD